MTLDPASATLYISFSGKCQVDAACFIRTKNYVKFGIREGGYNMLNCHGPRLVATPLSIS